MLPLRKVEQTEITHLWSATSSREIKNAGHNTNQIKFFVSINTQTATCTFVIIKNLVC